MSGTLSTLLQNGVPVLNALKITEQVIPNVILKEAISQTREAVTDGKTLAQKIQLLTDRAEIMELVHCYAHRVAHDVSCADLFTDDGIYWMPPAPEYKTWDGQPAIFAEDKNLMQVRMGRVLHPDAWSQRPQWGTNHVVSNVRIRKATATAVEVTSP